MCISIYDIYKYATTNNNQATTYRFCQPVCMSADSYKN